MEYRSHALPKVYGYESFCSAESPIRAATRRSDSDELVAVEAG